MTLNLRWLIILASNLLLIMAVGLVNHFAAPFSFYILLPALLIIPGCCYLSLERSLLCAAITGLCWGATAQTPAGHGFIMLCVFTTLGYYFRNPLRRASPLQAIWHAQVLNLLAIGYMAFTLGQAMLDERAYWVRVGSDTLASQLALLFATNWIYWLQRRALLWAGQETVSKDSTER